MFALSGSRLIVKNTFILIILILFGYATLKAQKDKDSSTVSLKMKPVFGFDRLIRNDQNREIWAPERLKMKRSYDYFDRGIFLNTNQYLEYPQTHFSYFGGADLNFTYKDFLQMDIVLIGENRSTSAGVLSTDHFVVYPRLILHLDDHFKLGKDSLRVEATVGDLVKFRNRAGLMVYNLDVQGGDMKFSFGDFYYGLTVIGDISRYIGLSIEELYSNRLGYKKRIGNKQLDLGLAMDIMPFYTAFSSIYEMDYIYSTYAILEEKESFSAYFELAYRDLSVAPKATNYWISPPNYNSSFDENIGALLAFEKNMTFWKSKLDLVSELRYYGRGYTKYLYEPKLLYRDINYQDFTGEYLYPLANAYRPYSQFAVFSEFQDVSISGLNLQVNTLTKLYQNLHFRLNLETLTLHTFEDEFLKGPFTYWFYETGLVYRITNDIEASVFISNKVMNLDLSYQTFYQSKLPLFGYAIRSKLPF